jgi:hypothetical protein
MGGRGLQLEMPLSQVISTVRTLLNDALSCSSSVEIQLFLYKSLYHPRANFLHCRVLVQADWKSLIVNNLNWYGVYLDLDLLKYTF